jgi:hypothetical protein
MMPPLQYAIKVAAAAGVITSEFRRWLERLAGPNGIDNDMLRDSEGLSVIGNATDETGDPGDITGTANQVLRVAPDGQSLGFGAVNLSAAAATTGSLLVERLNGGEGASESTFWRGDGQWASVETEDDARSREAQENR